MKRLDKNGTVIDEMIFELDLSLKVDSLGMEYLCVDGLYGPENNGYYCDPYRNACPLGKIFRYALPVGRSNRGMIIHNLSPLVDARFASTIRPIKLLKWNVEKQCTYEDEKETTINPAGFSIIGTHEQITEQIKSIFSSRWLDRIYPTIWGSRKAAGTVGGFVYTMCFVTGFVPFSDAADSTFVQYNGANMIAPLGFQTLRQQLGNIAALKKDELSPGEYEELVAASQGKFLTKMHLGAIVCKCILSNASQIQDQIDAYFYKVAVTTMWPEFASMKFAEVEDLYSQQQLESFQANLDEQLGMDW